MSETAPLMRASAFGLVWQSDIALDQFEPCLDDDTPTDVKVGQAGTLAERRMVRAINRGTVCADGIRFVWGDEATFDMIDGDRIAYLPGPAWRGTPPSPFYGTVTALLLAWRGLIPLHACAVAIGGKAVLLCGASGTGKSTLAAALVKHGATLLSDDLSAIACDPGRGDFQVLPGRRVLRLYPEVARMLAPVEIGPAADDQRGKLLARLAGETPRQSVPLAGMLCLGASTSLEFKVQRLARLRMQIFRPQWMAAMPHAPQRLAALRDMEDRIGFIALPALGRLNATGLDERAGAALALIEKQLLS